jgi:hypothetical protein
MGEGEQLSDLMSVLQGACGSWLMHCATSRKVVGLSPDEVDFFQFT